MRHYTVTGMHCTACSARVEKTVAALPGIEVCAVNLLTNSLSVEGSTSDKEIIKAVKGAGYGISVNDEGISSGDDAFADRETAALKKRLITSFGFLVVLMYISMGYNMFSLPLPGIMEENPLLVALLQMLLSSVVIIINRKFYINGIKGVINRAPNMDTLVALGSFASFAYSVSVVAMMFGDLSSSKHLLHELYFESAAMILVLITVGKMLEAQSKGKTTDALRSLAKLAPKTATVIVDGEEKVVGIGEIKCGDIFVVRAGENIPVDGVVLEGECSVNESALTGESIPVDKRQGDEINTATTNLSGYIKCRAVRVGADTTLSQIIRMVSDASATKAPIAKTADKVSGIFVPVVIAIAVITTAVWILCGESFGFSLARGVSVLVISCPCALGLATPVAIMVGNGVAARNGILFKTAASIEQTGRAKVVALDKTGTITKGEPEVTDIIPFGNVGESELMTVALSLERKSEHPLAKAIVKKGKELGTEENETEGFEVVSGGGVRAKLAEMWASAGNADFISCDAEVPDELRKKAERLSDEGKTPMYFAFGGKCIGIIAVADTIKEDSRSAVLALEAMGIRTVMLTGDNDRTAKAIAKLSGISEVMAKLKPVEKEKNIKKLSEDGVVIMVGDGINDAPALARADVGVAIGAGTDVAIDAADVVLVKNGLNDLVRAVSLSKAILRNIHQNLFWAFIYNVMGIPLAAGAFIPLLGWEMSPMFGAAAMSVSSLCVVTNALRLNFVKCDTEK